MTPYEVEWEKRIADNNKKINALNLQNLAQSLIESSSATKKSSSVCLNNYETLEPFFYPRMLHL
jgi:hypothetical protein